MNDDGAWPAHLWLLTQRAAELLVRGAYEELVAMTGGVRLSADELRRAVCEHGLPLEVPPSPEAARFDPVPIVSSSPPAWAVACDLWSRGAPSDLTLELTLRGVEQDGSTIEIDNLHVL